MAKKPPKPGGLGRGLDSILDDNRPEADRSEGRINIRRAGGTVSMNRAEIARSATPNPFANRSAAAFRQPEATRPRPFASLRREEPAPKAEPNPLPKATPPAEPVTKAVPAVEARELPVVAPVTEEPAVLPQQEPENESTKEVAAEETVEERDAIEPVESVAANEAQAAVPDVAPQGSPVIPEGSVTVVSNSATDDLFADVPRTVRRSSATRITRLSDQHLPDEDLSFHEEALPENLHAGGTYLRTTSGRIVIGGAAKDKNHP